MGYCFVSKSRNWKIQAVTTSSYASHFFKICRSILVSAKVLAALAEEVLDDEVIPHSTISFVDTRANGARRYSPSFPGQVQESRILVKVPSIPP